MNRRSFNPALYITAVLVLLSVLWVTVSIVFAYADFSGGWRIPVNSTAKITAGPGEGLHTGASAEAVDYSMNGQPFPVVAPADGAVIDILTPANNTGTFGNVLRINHNGVCSFYAHLTSWLVTNGQSVTQGQQVAISGKTGLDPTAGIHLHYEQRNGCVAGNVFTGSPVPVRSHPGNWWNTNYSPPPFLTPHPEASGGAQYPENSARPTTTTQGARHLSNPQSPPNPPAGWTSNITDGSATIHFGGNPNMPNTVYATWFDLHVFLQSCNCWSKPANGYSPNPSFTEPQNSGNQSYSNGQHTYLFYDYNQASGWSPNGRYEEFFTSKSAQRIPYLVAHYREGPDTTVLEYCTSGAVEYIVWESHNSSVSTAYQGTACSILVHRNLINADNQYIVQARYLDSGWSLPTNWLIVHY